MSGNNSLNQYKNTLLTSGQPANNFNRPNLDYRNGGRLESTNWNTIKTTTPSVQWNKYYTKDPILNFGSTSSSLDGGGFLETMSNIASGITFVGGAAMTAMGIFSAVKAIKGSNNASEGTFSRKENKEINKNSVDASSEMNSLDYAITYAEGLGDTDNIDDIETATKLLNSAKKEASIKKAEAAGAIDKANSKKEIAERGKREAASIMSTLAENKANYVSELNNTDPEPTPERKAELEKLIEKAEEDIQKQKALIAEYDKQIEVQNRVIMQNNETIKQLNENSDTADKLVAKFAAKLNVK